MKKFIISNTIFGSFVVPLIINKDGFNYCISNRQRKGSSIIYNKLEDKKSEIIIYNNNFDCVEMIFDDRFEKLLNHASLHCKRLSNENSGFEHLFSHLLLNGFLGFDKPFENSLELELKTKELWNCNWDNTNGNLEICVSFFEYYYTFQYLVHKNEAIIKQKRFNKKLFEESIDYEKTYETIKKQFK